MTIYDLKPQFQNLLRPIVRLLARNGVTPNQITWAAMLSSIAVGCALWISAGSVAVLLAVPLFLLIRMGLNAIDGMLAREHGMTTDGGAILNEMGDIISDAALYLPLALLPGVAGAGVVLFVLIGIFTETVGILGAAIGKQRRYDGPMGKSDRAFLMGLLALLLGMGLAPGPWTEVLLGTGIILGVVTIVRRWRGALEC